MVCCDEEVDKMQYGYRARKSSTKHAVEETCTRTRPVVRYSRDDVVISRPRKIEHGNRRSTSNRIEANVRDGVAPRSLETKGAQSRRIVLQ